MASTSNIAMAFASPSPSIDIPKSRDGTGTVGGFSAIDKHVAALLTPPNSISPNLPAHGAHSSIASPPPINIANEIDLQDAMDHAAAQDQPQLQEPAMPLSKGALSGLDASEAITPGMLAKHHLPGIMLGNGPRPIRYVMGELTHSVPGFSRIPPAKARRLVVAALESRNGGGLDGSVAFCKTGWGRWDAHVKGSDSSKDSAIGALQDGNLSPPRSENSSYAVSYSGSGLQIPRQRLPSGYRDKQSGGSWTASSILEEDEDMDMDMDMPENEADKMSLDGSDSDSTNADETDEEDWAAVGAAALRKASLPTPGAPRKNYNALSIPLMPRWPPRQTNRRPSAISNRSLHSTSMPCHWPSPGMETPEEKAAVEALLSMGSM